MAQATNRKPYDVTAALLLCCLLIGCATAGSVAWSPAVTNMFKNLELPDDHRFYFRGAEYRPTAVAGLRRGYAMASAQWTAVGPDTPEPDAFVRRLFREYGRSPHGYALYDAAGNPIGILYAGDAIVVDVRVSDIAGSVTLTIETPGAPADRPSE